MAKASIILTDSGDIRKSASLRYTSFGSKTETERPEAVEAGTVKLAGVDTDTIYELTSELLKDSGAYEKMANAVNPYGDGKTSQRIVEAIKNYFG